MLPAYLEGNNGSHTQQNPKAFWRLDGKLVSIQIRNAVYFGLLTSNPAGIRWYG